MLKQLVAALNVEAWVQIQASPCEMCTQHSSTGTGFSQSMLVFTCQYHSTNAPYSYSSNTLLLPEGETGEAWTPSQKPVLFVV